MGVLFTYTKEELLMKRVKNIIEYVVVFSLLIALCFYVNKDINFFLKRQAPFGYNGLYSSKLSPNDVFGNVKKENIYEYKDETNIVC